MERLEKSIGGTDERQRNKGRSQHRTTNRRNRKVSRSLSDSTALRQATDNNGQQKAL